MGDSLETFPRGFPGGNLGKSPEESLLEFSEESLDESVVELLEYWLGEFWVGFLENILIISW